MKAEETERLLTRQLRVREKLPLRELASRAGLDAKGCTTAIGNLVRDGVAVLHPGRGQKDRSPRYSKASNAKR